MKKEITTKLYETLKNNFEDETISNILEEMTEEDFDIEIQFIYQYLEFLKKQQFYLFKNADEEIYDEDGELIAFTPNNIYALWIEKDMCIYDVLSGCTDDYLDDVIDFWIAEQYDPAAIEMVVHYKNKRREFTEGV